MMKISIRLAGCLIIVLFLSSCQTSKIRNLEEDMSVKEWEILQLKKENADFQKALDKLTTSEDVDDVIEEETTESQDNLNASTDEASSESETQSRDIDDDIETEIQPIKLRPNNVHTFGGHTEYLDDNEGVFNFSEEMYYENSFIRAESIDLGLGELMTSSYLRHKTGSEKEYSRIIKKKDQEFYAFYNDGTFGCADLYEVNGDDLSLIDTLYFEKEFADIFYGFNSILYQVNGDEEVLFTWLDLKGHPMSAYRFDGPLEFEKIQLVHMMEPSIIFWAKGQKLTPYDYSLYYKNYEGDHYVLLDGKLYHNGILDNDTMCKVVGDIFYYLDIEAQELTAIQEDVGLYKNYSVPSRLLEAYPYMEGYFESDYWTVLKDGFLFHRKEYFSYFDFITERFIIPSSESPITSGSKITVVNQEAYLLGTRSIWHSENHYRFIEDEVRFYLDNSDNQQLETVSDYETMSWVGRDFVYDGIIYYEDNSDYFNGYMDVKDYGDLLKPVSQAPPISYNGGPIFISTTQEVDDMEFIRTLKEGMIGLVSNGQFEPLIRSSVKRFDCSKSGIAYTGYEDHNNFFYFDMNNNKNYEVACQEEVIDLQIMENYIYVLQQNKTLLRYPISELSTGNPDMFYTVQISEQNTDGEDFPGRLIDNESYLVYCNEPDNINLVFDKELKVVDQLTGGVSFIDDENNLYHTALIYVSKYNIEDKKDILINMSYWEPSVYYNGIIVYNTAYEGAGHSYVLDFKDTEIQPFLPNVDYSIELAMFYGNYVIAYDHIEKKLDLLHRYDSYEFECEVTEEGLYYFEPGQDKKFYPFRPGSSIEFYRAKRT